MKKILFLLFIVFVMSAFADSNTTIDGISSTTITGQIMTKFDIELKRWSDTIVPLAKNIFYFLAVVDIALSAIDLLLKGSDAVGYIALLAKKTITFSFFMILFNHSELVDAIFKTFMEAGNNISIVRVSPDNILSLGVEILLKIIEKINFSISSIVIIMAGFTTLVCLGMLAAQLFLAYVKVWSMFALAPLVYSLGALTQTRQYATGPIMAIFKASIELMTIKAFIGFCYAFMDGWTDNVSSNFDYAITVAAMSVLILSVIMGLNSLIEGLFAGVNPATSMSGFSTASNAIKTVGAAAAGVGGAVAAGAYAYKLTGEQKAAGDTGASFMKNMASSYASSAFKNSATGNLRDQYNAAKNANKTKEQ